MYPRHDWYYGNHMMNDGAFGWIAALIPLLFLAALIGLAFYFIKIYASRPHGTNDARDPLDIARERYAKGEITKEELAEIKRELK